MKTGVKHLVRLYPRAWRERYGAELLLLIDECGTTGPRAAVDLMAGALREQLRAIFVHASPRRRQLALFWLTNLGSWAIGTVAAVLIALVLPDFETGGTLRSVFFVISLAGTVGVFFYASVVKDNAPGGLASGVPPLTPILAGLGVVMALATAVLADLSLAHSYRIGLATFNDLLVSGARYAIVFGPIGTGIAGIFWPAALRDLNPGPPSSSSTLGLGA